MFLTAPAPWVGRAVGWFASRSCNMLSSSLSPPNKDPLVLIVGSLGRLFGVIERTHLHSKREKNVRIPTVEGMN